jgi:hypothetical protein
LERPEHIHRIFNARCITQCAVQQGSLRVEFEAPSLHGSYRNLRHFPTGHNISSSPVGLTTAWPTLSSGISQNFCRFSSRNDLAPAIRTPCFLLFQHALHVHINLAALLDRTAQHNHPTPSLCNRPPTTDELTPLILIVAFAAIDLARCALSRVRCRVHNIAPALPRTRFAARRNRGRRGSARRQWAD